MEKSFIGVVHFNEHGELDCFCYQEEADRGLCVCREKYDCPQAKVSIETIPGTRPSDEPRQALNKANRNLQETAKGLEKSSKKIKEGLRELEKATRKNRFRL